ncbi:MAG TPA: triple tyrosine motif-containing protein [Melioribacteraceae bacterium]|nr:triple tyrosine motif-containing protein [Melioribacteraceae bacterium]
MKTKFFCNKISKYFTISLFLLIVVSCNNGGTTDAPPAFIQFVQAPLENAILSSNSVIFVWRGSDDNFTYRYRLVELNDESPSDYIDWSNYAKDSEIEFTNLNEGKYQFQLEAKNKNYNTTLTRKFSIDAIKGPSLSFNKITTISSIGLADSVSVWMEDIQELAAFKVAIDFNPNVLIFDGVSGGKNVINSSFNQLIVPNFSLQSIKDDVNRTGRIIVNSAFLKSELSNESLSGSGKILNIRFIGKNLGTTKLEFTNIELRKLDGTIIFNKTPGIGTYSIK